MVIIVSYTRGLPGNGLVVLFSKGEGNQYTLSFDFEDITEALSALDRAERAKAVYPEREFALEICGLVRYRLTHEGYIHDPVYGEKLNTAAMVEVIDKMADVIIENEVAFCDADKMGDGDFGMSIAKGFRQLKTDWKSRKKGNVGEFLLSCSEIIKEYCGGASGPIWGSAFKYAGKAAGTKEEISLADLAEIMQAANTGVYETGKRSFGKGAVVGEVDPKVTSNTKMGLLMAGITDAE